MAKVYIAGPMTGIPDFNRPAFHRMAANITEQGDVALNPAVLPDGLSQAEYMDICCAMVRCADTIYMLKDWDTSSGARAELSLAIKLGHKVFYQDLE
ncbi:DUF4406 domain-containing protein [Trabulsiella odontotermitis]|uniref:DUF4406 domain-containing protein n=1 Tax=Trabulsiella odontotermitis TaxID=379893 RepID=UPI003AC7C192